VSWTGDTPDEYCGPLAEVFNAFNDAPHGENEEPEFWDAKRDPGADGKRRASRAAAQPRHRRYPLTRPGRWPRNSAVLVDPEASQWGFQQLTAVIRTHRGHRLGLLVKTAMLELLASAEPQIEWIATGNAASNEHMIAVNEQLGYKVGRAGLAVLRDARRGHALSLAAAPVF